jgi:hypothetical protein
MQPLRIGLARVGAGPPPPPHTLTGTVTLADQSDASGITVEAVEESSGLAMDTSATDENGLYYLWVPAGAYLLTASKSGYQSASQHITILPCEVGTLDFMLSKARH